MELVETAENDPGMSLVVLRRIADSGSSAEQVMRKAALQAAANAAGITNTILRHLPDVSSIDESEAVSVVTDAIADMRNLSEAAALLLQILPSSPADEHAFDAFDPADLAMAAIVILSSEAASHGDVEGYLNSPAGPGYDYAKKMAKSAGDRYTGGGSLGAVLDGLHLQ
jgi:DNA-directed RNA polymerase subunit F